MISRSVPWDQNQRILLDANRFFFPKNGKNPQIFKDFRAFLLILWDARDVWDAARHASVSTTFKRGYAERAQS